MEELHALRGGRRSGIRQKSADGDIHEEWTVRPGPRNDRIGILAPDRHLADRHVGSHVAGIEQVFDRRIRGFDRPEFKTSSARVDCQWRESLSGGGDPRHVPLDPVGLRNTGTHLHLADEVGERGPVLRGGGERQKQDGGGKQRVNFHGLETLMAWVLAVFFPAVAATSGGGTLKGITEIGPS